MKKLTALILVVSSVWSGSGFGWGEAGHHLIARSAARLAEKHPALKEVKDVEARRALDQFLKVLRDRHYQQGHLANIPDVYWRNLEDGLAQAGNQLGSPTHYLNAEYLAPEGAKDPYLESKVPLDYEAARSYVSGLYPSISLFKTVGTAPWRAQQFATLMKSALEATPKAACETYENKEAPPTRAMLTFAGILAHYTGDSAQPLHSTKDFDAVATGQKGLHWYFENDLVNALSPPSRPKWKR